MKSSSGSVMPTVLALVAASALSIGVFQKTMSLSGKSLQGMRYSTTKHNYKGLFIHKIKKLQHAINKTIIAEKAAIEGGDADDSVILHEHALLSAMRCLRAAGPRGPDVPKEGEGDDEPLDPDDDPGESEPDIMVQEDCDNNLRYSTLDGASVWLVAPPKNDTAPMHLNGAYTYGSSIAGASLKLYSIRMFKFLGDKKDFACNKEELKNRLKNGKESEAFFNEAGEEQNSEEGSQAIATLKGRYKKNKLMRDTPWYGLEVALFLDDNQGAKKVIKPFCTPVYMPRLYCYDKHCVDEVDTALGGIVQTRRRGYLQDAKKSFKKEKRKEALVKLNQCDPYHEDYHTDYKHLNDAVVLDIETALKSPLNSPRGFYISCDDLGKDAYEHYVAASDKSSSYTSDQEINWIQHSHVPLIPPLGINGVIAGAHIGGMFSLKQDENQEIERVQISNILIGSPEVGADKQCPKGYKAKPLFIFTYHTAKVKDRSVYLDETNKIQLVTGRFVTRDDALPARFYRTKYNYRTDKGAIVESLLVCLPDSSKDQWDVDSYCGIRVPESEQLKCRLLSLEDSGGGSDDGKGSNAGDGGVDECEEAINAGNCYDCWNSCSGTQADYERCEELGCS